MQQVVGDPVPGGGPGGAHRPARPGAGQAQRPHAPLHGAPGHPGALLPGARQPPGLLGSQCRVERLGPRGRGSPLDPGAAFREQPGRAGRTGRRESSGRGRSCTPTRSGRRRPSTGPELLLALVDAVGGSARRALTLRRHGQADALRPIAPPAPGPRTSNAGSPVRRAPWRIPAAQGLGLIPGSSPTRLKHTPGRSGSARAPRRQPDRTSPSLIGALPGCGHDPHPSMDSDPPPHPGRSTNVCRGLL